VEGKVATRQREHR